MTARVVFMGTPRSAIPTLEGLARTQDVALVITQPDRPKGRSKKPKPPPVKEVAQQMGLPVSQPASRADLVDALTKHGSFDLGVVVAYGRILRPEILERPAHGLLNVHFSLLPRWRGAAPVARAIMAGDTMTGVTIIRLDEGLDTGPVLTAQAIDIRDDENTGSLTGRLAELGARLLTSSIDPYVGGELVPVDQTDEGVVYAEKLTRDDRPIDLSATTTAIVSQVRGLAPEPGATLEIDGERHKVLGGLPHEADVEPSTWRVVDGAPVFGAADGSVEITLIKPPGRNLQSGSDWVRGHRSDQGSVA
ncbi:MAG: methionyl-tRNA formyltransferase [Acidimicrobiia bacterium]|jgi:methionyl-tRNA formyltransferase